MPGKVTQEAIEGVRALIRTGQAQRGGRLPSERELAERLCVSRSTLRSALAFMRQNGELVTRNGRASGTYVSKQNPYWSLYALIDTSLGSHEVLDHPLAMPQGVPVSASQGGERVETEVISADELTATASLATVLAVEEGDPVYAVKRLRRSSDAPLSLETAYLAAWRFPGFLDLDLRKSVYSLMLSRYGVAIARIVEAIEVVGATSETGRYLGIGQGTPLFFNEASAFDENGRCVEFSSDYYRTDRVRFVAEHRFQR